MGESGHCIWLMLYRVAACIFYCCCMQWVYSYRISGSRKIQTLCHMTQVLLILSFTVMERFTGY